MVVVDLDAVARPLSARVTLGIRQLVLVLLHERAAVLFLLLPYDPLEEEFVRELDHGKMLWHLGRLGLLVRRVSQAPPVGLERAHLGLNSPLDELLVDVPELLAQLRPARLWEGSIHRLVHVGDRAVRNDLHELVLDEEYRPRHGIVGLLDFQHA